MINNEGCFWIEKIFVCEVKNWLWMCLNNCLDVEWKKWFVLLKECGILGVMFEGYNENIYCFCKEVGLEVYYWKWMMNCRELLDKYFDWYVVNCKGEFCYDKLVYVDYYCFLCFNY